MRSFNTRFVLALAILVGYSATSQAQERQREHRAVTALLDSVALWISNRDAPAIASRMPTDSSIVYVSDGHAIRGTELKQVLQSFYSSVRSLAFAWDSLRVEPLGDRIWGATAWARISATDSLGQVANAKAIFTWTVVRRNDRWLLALAHKATLQ